MIILCFMMKVPVKIPSPPIYTNLDICRTKDIVYELDHIIGCHLTHIIRVHSTNAPTEASNISTYNYYITIVFITTSQQGSGQLKDKDSMYSIYTQTTKLLYLPIHRIVLLLGIICYPRIL